MRESGSVVEGGHAGQHLAFQQFEAGAATGGDVGHLFGQTGLLHSSHGVTAADDRAAALGAELRQGGGANIVFIPTLVTNADDELERNRRPSEAVR